MNRRDVLKLVTAAVPSMFLASMVEASPKEGLVKLASGEDLLLLKPPTLEHLAGALKNQGHIVVTGVSGAVLETDQGPIHLQRHQFAPIFMRQTDNLHLTWFFSLSGDNSHLPGPGGEVHTVGYGPLPIKA